MNCRRIFFVALTLLATIPACVIPSIAAPSTPLPTLTVDSAAIETMVALTVSAAIAQTEQSVPSPEPASIIVVTAQTTSTPAPIATPTYAPQATATPTPEAASLSQSLLTRLEDGSMLFADNRAGYQIQLPPGWLAVRLNEKEYLESFSLQEAANTHIQQALLGVQNEDPNSLRLFALDTQPAHIQNEFVSDIRFMLDAGKVISLNSNDGLQAIADKIPASATVFRFEVTSTRILTSVSGMQFGIIEAGSSFTNSAGVEVPLYQKQVYFNTRGGIQSITLTTLAGLKPALLPIFDAMLETIKPQS
jgi:hypothetical protein